MLFIVDCRLVTDWRQGFSPYALHCKQFLVAPIGESRTASVGKSNPSTCVSHPFLPHVTVRISKVWSIPWKDDRLMKIQYTPGVWHYGVPSFSVTIARQEFSLRFRSCITLNCAPKVNDPRHGGHLKPIFRAELPQTHDKANAGPLHPLHHCKPVSCKWRRSNSSRLQPWASVVNVEQIEGDVRNWLKERRVAHRMLGKEAKNL